MPTYEKARSAAIKATADEDVRVTLSAAERKAGLEVKRAGVHPREMVCVKPGSEAMASALEAAYGISPADAEKIIKERDADPARWPFEEYKRAQAVIAAFNAKPEAVSTSPHYQRRRTSRMRA